jgi:peptide/nickel transport system ATP-binding protein
MTLLAVENLQLKIHGQPILHDIDFTVAPGETLGIIGESGSGKSLSALSIMQLLPNGSEVSGSIIFDGGQLLDKSEREMCDVRGDEIGMVFQEPMTALNPVQTIGQQVAETVAVHQRTGRRAAMKVAAQTLERVGLPNDRFPLSRYPHELSGGQRQRVVIAMAIALRPRLLICDEPTTALDVTTQAQVISLLKSLTADSGMGLILISHDLAVVADTADHIVILRHGRVVDSGPANTIFTELRHPYTQQLYRASAYAPAHTREGVDTQALLEVREVCRDYPLPRRTLFGSKQWFRAVDSVSFVIRRGENVGLVGESGCGKSTLARAILGLEPCQSGSIVLDGEVMYADTGMPQSLRRKVQVVFQDPYASFNPRHKVSRLVAEPFHLLSPVPDRNERARRVAEALISVGLTEADGEKYIHEFSGGQRQRIAIARALIIRPQLIVLDEPVSALDVSIRAQILDLLAGLSAQLQLSYLFISHDLSVVRAITDRVLIMQAGKIVEQGDTEMVFNAPQHPYTKSLLASVPRLPGS